MPCTWYFESVARHQRLSSRTMCCGPVTQGLKLNHANAAGTGEWRSARICPTSLWLARISIHVDSTFDEDAAAKQNILVQKRGRERWNKTKAFPRCTINLDWKAPPADHFAAPGIGRPGLHHRGQLIRPALPSSSAACSDRPWDVLAAEAHPQSPAL